MLLDYFQGRYNTTDVVIVSIIMIFALILHNIVQAYVASRYGDSSPKFAGFMHFDPQRQLEPIGVIFLFLLGFGWPKTINVNSRNYSGRGRQEAMVWYSGPLTYLAVAFFSVLLATVFNAVNSPVLARSFFLAASVSTLHAVINLFPVYPLDGARAALAWGNSDVRRIVQQIASYGLLGFIVVFLLLSFTGIINGLISFFLTLFIRIVGLIPGL